MSTYPFWLLSFDLRAGVEPHALDVLSAVGRGDDPDPAALDRLPPVPRFYLADSRRLQSDQGETVAGTPVRIAHRAMAGVLTEDGRLRSFAEMEAGLADDTDDDYR